MSTALNTPRMTMPKRFIWQFEIDMDNPLQFSTCHDQKDPLSWEARFFWQDNEIVTLHGLTSEYIELSHYRFKRTCDTYYLLPDTNDNIKERREKFFYKLLIEEKNGLFGYSKKIPLEDNTLKNYSIRKILRDAKRVVVRKEVLSCKLDTQPVIKFEIARLMIQDRIVMTCCLEGYSFFLVDTLRNHLIQGQKTCHYIHFIKSVLQDE